ncbi:uncharacterized protein LOC118503471 [Anopheles stephensi]|uniref:uncharacterized protein LOC118503471 n=1 Tax=Anopheles stephensi TaxID=30069 RepID=UPI00165889C9|nr:uncharacterized protein LOC118503471 [Anopheles stephensi]
MCSGIQVGALRRPVVFCRLSSEIRDPLCLKSLYRWRRVRSTLEYAAVVWSPPGSTAMARLESVQRKFTRVAVRRFLYGYQLALPPYPVRCRLLGLDTIEDRHFYIRASFIAGLLLNKFDVHSLLPPDVLPLCSFPSPPR